MSSPRRALHVIALPRACVPHFAHNPYEQGGARSLTLIASTTATSDVEAVLAAVAPHASCERLELVWHPAGPPVELGPSQRLQSLPHVRRMSMHHMRPVLVSLWLPMPRLEELDLPETPEMFAPFVTRAVALGVRGSAVCTAPPFPALRRLSVATTALLVNPAAGAREGRCSLAWQCLEAPGSVWPSGAVPGSVGLAGCGPASKACLPILPRSTTAAVTGLPRPSAPPLCSASPGASVCQAVLPRCRAKVHTPSCWHPDRPAHLSGAAGREPSASWGVQGRREGTLQAGNRQGCGPLRREGTAQPGRPWKPPGAINWSAGSLSNLLTTPKPCPAPPRPALLLQAGLGCVHYQHA